ncbi:fumarylacetoacetate hydrolase family protein [Gordonia sp. NPDC003376]
MTYTSPTTRRRTVGVVVGDHVVGDSSSTTTLLQLIRTGENLTDAGHAVVADADEKHLLIEVEVHAPIDTPPTFRDHMSFEGHVVNCNAQLGRTVDPVWYRQPTFYFSNPYSIIGPTDDVTMAPGSALFDYELEVGAVIGTAGSDLAPQDAEDHICGYMVLCDWSARDLQAAEVGIGLGPVKGKDTATSLGPMLVTPDELGDVRTERGYRLSMTASVNGVEISSGNWSDLHWSFGDMIAYASRGTRVAPGDLIGSGTVATGCLLEHIGVDPTSDRWLAPGDVVTLEIERLGRIRSTVRAARPVPGIPAPATA